MASPSDFPLVGREFITPYVITVPASAWESFTFARPVVLQPLSPTTVGTVFARPGGQPNSTSDAIPFPAGIVELGGAGKWFLRTSSGADEQFRVIDGASASALLMALAASAFNLVSINGVAQTGLNLTGLYQPITMDAPGAGSAGVASNVLLAAASTRRFLYIRNTHASQRVSLSFGAAAVLDSGVTLNPNEWASWSAPTGHVTQEVRAIASGAATTVAIQTGT